MPREFSEAMKEAIASVDTRVVFIDTLVISCDDFDDDYRFCRGDVDLIIGGLTYLGKNFESSMPQVASGQNSSLTVTIGQALGLFTVINSAIKNRKTIKCTLNTYLAGDINATALFTKELLVKSPRLEKGGLSFTAGYPDMVNKKVPSIVYTTKNTTGLRNV